MQLENQIKKMKKSKNHHSIDWKTEGQNGIHNRLFEGGKKKEGSESYVKIEDENFYIHNE